jgi:hypothetical protein
MGRQASRDKASKQKEPGTKLPPRLLEEESVSYTEMDPVITLSD